LRSRTVLPLAIPLAIPLAAAAKRIARRRSRPDGTLVCWMVIRIPPGNLVSAAGLAAKCVPSGRPRPCEYVRLAD